MPTTDTTFTIVGTSNISGGGDGLAPNPSGQSVNESISSQSPLVASLKAGLGIISEEQTVTFVPYVKLVLPLDGYVFWVKASLLSPSALLNVARYNSFSYNQPQREIGSLPDLIASGSLHIATTNQQDPDESFSVNRVVFTSKISVNDLNEVSPLLMYVATIGDFRFAFSQRQSFYKQADLFHYVGDAVYPTLESQLIDSIDGFDTQNIIVSNSLPIWLGLNQFMPMFPSFLVPDNIRPPYGAVHIPPESTRALQAFPVIDKTGSHWQLVADRVHITIYGLRNFNALDFQDYINYQSLVYENFGIMNMPVIRDEKRGQVELSVIAMKKSFELEISYYQSRVKDIARQLILQAIPKFFIGGGVEPVEIEGDGTLDWSKSSQSGLFTVVN